MKASGFGYLVLGLLALVAVVVGGGMLSAWHDNQQDFRDRARKAGL